MESIDYLYNVEQAVGGKPRTHLSCPGNVAE